jgi:Regulator of chromosome condensation (RCC1) repeat
MEEWQGRSIWMVTRFTCINFRGSGNFGKLGHGNRSNYTTPKLVECFKEASAVGMKVCEIVCGDNHTLAVLENADDGHELFVWGSSKSWQLGLEGDISDDVLEPHSIDPDPFDGKVLTIGGCHNYSSCVTKDGRVCAFDFFSP